MNYQLIFTDWGKREEKIIHAPSLKEAKRQASLWQKVKGRWRECEFKVDGEPTKVNAKSVDNPYFVLQARLLVIPLPA